MNESSFYRDAFILLLLMICVSYSPNLFAQIKHYTPNDGFNYTGTENILQDGQGFIWLQGQRYLNKFDGYTFTDYKHNPEDSLALIGPVIGKLLLDNTGNIWINNAEATWLNGTLLKYDRKSDGFIRYNPNLKSFVRNISIENDDLIWIATIPQGAHSPTKANIENTGLYLYNLRTNETIHYLNRMEPDQLEINNNIRSIEERGSHLLLGTANGLWNFEKSTKTFSRPRVSDPARLLTGVITKAKNILVRWDEGTIFKVDSSLAIIEEFAIPDKIKSLHGFSETNDNKFWCIVDDKLVYWDPQTNLMETRYVSELAVQDLLIDRNQNVWFVGFNEVARYEPPVFHYAETPKSPSQWKFHFIRNEKRDLGILLGADNQIHMAPVGLHPGQFIPFDFSGRTAKRSEYNNVHEGKNHLWIGTWGRGVVRIPIDRNKGELVKTDVLYYENIPGNPNSITLNNIHGMCEAENGYLWVCTNGEGLCLIKPDIPYGTEGSVLRFLNDPRDKNSISSNLPTAVLAYGEEVWVGTVKGIDVYKDGKFKNILSNDDIKQLFRAHDGNIYALSDIGLYVSRKEEGFRKFNKVVSPTVGLFSPIAVQDNAGRIWLSETNGLRVYDPVSGNTTLCIGHGPFKASALSFLSESVSSKGYIGFALEKTLITFDPAQLKIDSSKTYPLITKALVNYKQPIAGEQKLIEGHYRIPAYITVLDQLILDHLHNNFSLEFSAMEMTAPGKNFYKYKLDGYDHDWIETNASDRVATYTNLDPGNYLFKLKASNHYGVWSDAEKTLKVKILPPPWRTWWAYSGYLMLVTGLLIGARRLIVQMERYKASMQVEHVELEKAKEVDRVKTSFFTNISHEFRTPLTLIKGPVQDLLEKYTSDPKTQEKLKLVQRNSDLLLKLINQLLDLAKLESGSLKVEKTEGDVFSFVRAVASSFESFARQKHVALQVDVPEGSCAALFDMDKVETILINLINNAIKFTPSGGSVAVIAGVGRNESEQTRDPQIVALTVRDTGIGIPPEHQQKIFERFHQISEAHKEVGTGIGLALVKELVALMGGEIGLTSEVGVGSEFKVQIPIEMVASYQSPGIGEKVKISELEQIETGNRQPAAMNNQSNDDESNKPQVLVVEDNTDLRKFIIDSLGTEFNFLEAENGKQGLSISQSEVPDLIISDVMMPEMDGITMAGKIKTDIRTSHIPLILLTAKSSEDSKLSGLQSGADDYLTKPFNKNELLLKVRNGISRQQKLREKLRAELMSTAPKVEVLSEDEKFLNTVKEKILERLSDEQLSVESLAEDMGMSRVQLYRKVSGLTDISVNELIRKLRLQRAAQLLSQNWGPVSQVAYEVGFSNLSYFSKVFKEEFGVLPSEYAE